MDFNRISNYWGDISQQPTTFSTLPDDDFLALLQRQFPTSIGSTPKPLDIPPDGVDPQSITSFSIPTSSPGSSDSSPSPPSMNDTPISRPQSGIFNRSPEASDDPTLKRKASDESMDDEPTSKNAHTNGSVDQSRKSSASRRKSSGNPQQKDEFRLMKRKEQNRAAQRAFRERKEKHVKDLEDKVAALEAKNQVAESENGNLRDLLSRLQSENMAMKEGNFTFQVNKDGSAPVASNSFSPQPRVDVSPAYLSPTPNNKSPVIGSPQFNFDFHQLIPFDPSVIDEAPQATATDGAMNMDYGFGGSMPYRTLASNPMYMSFAEPMNLDLTPTQQSPQPNSHPSPAVNLDNMHGLTSFENWSSPDSLDQLFGGNYMGAQSPVDFAALLSSPPSSISPISHHNSIRSNSMSSSSPSTHPQQISSPSLTNSSSSSQSTPGSTSESSSSPSPSLVTPATPIDLTSCVGECPKTKDDMRNMIEKKGSSQFAQLSEGANLIRKNTDGDQSLIMCEGSSFPKTLQSDKNIEVLTAWRTITSNPQFKDVDINELCTEFTSKARCDGTKVVLEPEGVHRIMEALALKRQQQQQQQQSQQQQQQASRN
ncbi:hypothetical protein EUX98_g3791 [Antrodiella citrinella]|uniref:BZIP domain-containing protein n=1 Tax=Antrodiella citrinella TaxID=2447956 RepID=A0A4S4MVL6_9APHY|nr:hypothetical protein EUX98_g3791 [Antrodiella citrinella]